MALSRIGIIGDVHGEATRLFNAIQILLDSQVERILCVGDVADGKGGQEASACCQFLRAFNVATARGNHDRWLVNGEMRDLKGAVSPHAIGKENVDWLRALPRTLALETTRGSLLLCHGVGENDMKELKPDDYGYALECNDELQTLVASNQYRFVVGGHTHQSMLRRFGDLTFINAGALPNCSGPGFALADFEQGYVEFYGFDGDEVKRELHERLERLPTSDTK